MLEPTSNVRPSTLSTLESLTRDRAGDLLGRVRRLEASTGVSWVGIKWRRFPPIALTLVVAACSPGSTTATPAASSATSPFAGNGSIAFSSERDGNVEIYVRSADGSQRRLTNDPGKDRSPTWSPDGTHIAFESERDGNPEIYVMSSDGTAVTRLTNDPGGDGMPAWSPTARRSPSPVTGVETPISIR